MSSYSHPRYIALPPYDEMVQPWDNSPITLEPIRRTVDPYNYGWRNTRAMIKWDNSPKYERDEFHMDELYGHALYEDELQLRGKGYTGRVSPLERRYTTNNRYR